MFFNFNLQSNWSSINHYPNNFGKTKETMTQQSGSRDNTEEDWSNVREFLWMVTLFVCSLIPIFSSIAHLIIRNAMQCLRTFYGIQKICNQLNAGSFMTMNENAWAKWIAKNTTKNENSYLNQRNFAILFKMYFDIEFESNFKFEYLHIFFLPTKMKI